MPVSISPLSYESSYEIWRKILQMELVRLRQGSSIGSRKSSNSGSLDRQRVYGFLYGENIRKRRGVQWDLLTFSASWYIYVYVSKLYSKRNIFEFFFLDYLQDLLSKAVEYQRFNWTRMNMEYKGIVETEFRNSLYASKKKEKEKELYTFE